MTQPTQAQIEAAEPRYKLLTGKFGAYRFFDTRDDRDMPLAVVLERLNAATQVGEQERMQRDKYFSHNHVFKNDHCIHCGIAENDWNKMFAAAQVGEPMTKQTEKDLAAMIMDADLPKRLEQELENRTYQLNHALLDLKEIEAATIERCAQVAEGCNNGVGAIRLEIAAAIRKLKETR